MWEDYYSDEDEKVDSRIHIYYHNNITKILLRAKDEIKNYIKVIAYLTQKELDKINKGGPTTITLFAKKDRPDPITFDYLTEDRSNLPSILYLTEEQCKKYNYHYLNGGSFNLTLSKKQLSATLNEIKKIDKKIDSLFNELRDLKDDFDILVNCIGNMIIS